MEFWTLARAPAHGRWHLLRPSLKARVDTLDFPELTPITRGFAEKLGVADRYEYLERDMRAADFGRENMTW